MNRTELVEAAQKAFRERFDYDPQAVGVAPGRVELLGNHTDYNEGFVLPCAIAQSIAVVGAARETPRARVASADRDGIAVFDPANPSKDAPAWSAYVKGVVDELNKIGANIGGFDALIVGDVPIGAGVSSSAALEVATAQFLLSLYPHSIAMNAMELAKLCRRAENNFVGAPVGLLDMFSSIFGQAGHALFLDCRTFAHRALPLPEDRARILIADTGVKHALAMGGGYSERRAQCEVAAAWFAEKTGAPIKSLRDVTPEMLESAEGELDATLMKRARHIVYENKRVEMGATALEGGHLGFFGEMMSNAHESCRRFFENSCDELDLLVDTAHKVPGVYGAKLSGGGWGGAVVVLHAPECEAELYAALNETYLHRFSRAPILLPTTAAQGADAFRYS